MCQAFQLSQPGVFSNCEEKHVFTIGEHMGHAWVQENGTPHCGCIYRRVYLISGSWLRHSFEKCFSQKKTPPQNNLRLLMNFWALWLVILDFFEGLAWKNSQKGGGKMSSKTHPTSTPHGRITWPSDDLIFNVLVGLVQSIIIHHLKLKSVKFDLKG